jgi:hypothetical protein
LRALRLGDLALADRFGFFRARIPFRGAGCALRLGSSRFRLAGLSRRLGVWPFRIGPRRFHLAGALVHARALQQSERDGRALELLDALRGSAAESRQ